MLSAVVNLSEGRRPEVVADLAAAGGSAVLDVHLDGDHNRCVVTLAGPDVVAAARAVATRAVGVLDLAVHDGAHPRIGVVDVVPWVSLAGWPVSDGPPAPAVAARDAFARWAADEVGVPCFTYGPGTGDPRADGAVAGPGGRPPGGGGRTLPDIRRRAWRDLSPDTGGPRPHPRAGAMAVGARPVLVAYNLWLTDDDLARARAIAREIRTPQVRTLGLAVGGAVQVSCNLIDPWRVGPGAAFDAVARRGDVARAELVGLVPSAVLAAEPSGRWAELDLSPATTIEARLEEAGLDGGR